MIVHTRPTQVQTSEYPSSFPNQETYLQLIPDGKGKSTFSNEVLLIWVYQPHFRAGLMPRSCWLTQNRFCALCVYVFVHTHVCMCMHTFFVHSFVCFFEAEFLSVTVLSVLELTL